MITTPMRRPIYVDQIKLQFILGLGLIPQNNQPTFRAEDLCIEGRIGSYSHFNDVEGSDLDIWGVFVPSLLDMFPHLKGVIHGLSNPPRAHSHWSEHGIELPDGGVDLTYESLPRYIRSLTEGDPCAWDRTLHVCGGTFKLGAPWKTIIDAAASKLTAHRLMKRSGSLCEETQRSAWGKFPMPQKSHRAAASKRAGYNTNSAAHSLMALYHALAILSGDIELGLEAFSHVREVKHGKVRRRDFLAAFRDMMENYKSLVGTASIREKPARDVLYKAALDTIEHYRHDPIEEHIGMEAWEKIKRLAVEAAGA